MFPCFISLVSVICIFNCEEFIYGTFEDFICLCIFVLRVNIPKYKSVKCFSNRNNRNAVITHCNFFFVRVQRHCRSTHRNWRDTCSSHPQFLDNVSNVLPKTKFFWSFAPSLLNIKAFSPPNLTALLRPWT